MHHPWRVFRSLVGWRLHWSHDLPEDQMGEVDFNAQTVTLAHGLTQAERRCTIAHETQHIIRGPVLEHLQDREEIAADRLAARLLMPDVRVIGEAMAWAHNLSEAADELWVDEPMLRARLGGLHPSERGYLRSRLAELEHAGDLV